MSDDETTDTPTPDADVITDEVVADVEAAHDELAEAESRRGRAVDAEPEPDPNLVTVNLNGRDVPARKGDMVIAAALRGRRVRPALLLPPAHVAGRHVPPVHGRGRGSSRPDDGGVVHDPGRRRPGGAHRHPAGQARPGGHARAAARQPPARLPGLRQGRRVPAAGPGVQSRARRVSLRRGEAPLREADSRSAISSTSTANAASCATAAPVSPTRSRATS